MLAPPSPPPASAAAPPRLGCFSQVQPARARAGARACLPGGHLGLPAGTAQQLAEGLWGHWRWCCTLSFHILSLLTAAGLIIQVHHKESILVLLTACQLLLTASLRLLPQLLPELLPLVLVQGRASRWDLLSVLKPGPQGLTLWTARWLKCGEGEGQDEARSRHQAGSTEAS